jgi:hypothetical protein
MNRFEESPLYYYPYSFDYKPLQIDFSSNPFLKFLQSIISNVMDNLRNDPIRREILRAYTEKDIQEYGLYTIKEVCNQWLLYQYGSPLPYNDEIKEFMRIIESGYIYYSYNDVYSYCEAVVLDPRYSYLAMPNMKGNMFF